MRVVFYNYFQALLHPIKFHKYLREGREKEGENYVMPENNIIDKMAAVRANEQRDNPFNFRTAYTDFNRQFSDKYNPESAPRNRKIAYGAAAAGGLALMTPAAQSLLELTGLIDEGNRAAAQREQVLES